MTDRNHPPSLRGEMRIITASLRTHAWGAIERWAHRRGHRALTDDIWADTRRRP